ncbi:MAG: fatty acid desaturase [Gammaproteobacteria bacterium]|jgi:fatty acid desaturase|nr:fatty acid desaturase [Gammaproteobacteria bacterium]
MFRFSADRFPVFLVLLLSTLDFTMYFMVDNIWLLLIYLLVMIIPKGIICAWNHHHQHTPTFFWKPLNRLLEFFYALHTGATTNLWVLHHVLGHHRNFLDQSSDESAWQRKNGKAMNEFEYTLSIAFTAYFRGFQVGRKFARVQYDFVLYSLLTLSGLILLSWFNFVPAMILFILPMIISLFFTAWVTYDHHSGLETGDQFLASYNNINRLFNILTGNLGYHTAHHFNQGLHWSKLPELHAKIKYQIPPDLIRNAVFVIAET